MVHDRPYHTHRPSPTLRPRPIQAAGAIAPTAPLALTAVLAVLVWRRWRPRRVVVQGSSMAPALAGGDRLLVLREPHLRPGDVVALPDPRRPQRLIVKRIAALDGAGGRVTVLGDNADASTDSRAFGAVDPRVVLGRVRYRYGPPDRVGVIPRLDEPAADSTADALQELTPRGSSGRRQRC